MDTSDAQLELADGKFIDFTDVPWVDIVLNVAQWASFLGLLVWCMWWRREWKYGDEGAAKRYADDPQRGARARWIYAAVSLTASVVQPALALPYWLSGHEGALFAVVWGGVALALWAVLLRFARPGIERPARAPHDGGRVAREKVKAKEREEKMREEGRKAVASLRPVPGPRGERGEQR